MSNRQQPVRMIDVLKDHEVRLRNIETKVNSSSEQEDTNTEKSGNNVLSSPTVSSQFQTDINKKLSSLAEYIKEQHRVIETLEQENIATKEIINNLLRDFDRLKDLYIVNNIEFLRFKQSMMKGNEISSSNVEPVMNESRKSEILKKLLQGTENIQVLVNDVSSNESEHFKEEEEEKENDEEENEEEENDENES